MPACPAGAVNLAVHLFQQNALEAQRRYQHGIGLTGQALQSHIVEHCAGFLADFLPGGDEGKVSVQLAGSFRYSCLCQSVLSICTCHPCGW